MTKGNSPRAVRMPPTSPDTVVWTDAHRGDLDRLVRAGRTEQRLTLRAGIVLAAADGQSNAGIAASLGVCPDTARKWQRRWRAAPGVSSLGDAKRSGWPAVFSPVQIAQVKAVACTLPKDHGLPLSRWSCLELARRLATAAVMSILPIRHRLAPVHRLRRRGHPPPPTTRSPSTPSISTNAARTSPHERTRPGFLTPDTETAW